MQADVSIQFQVFRDLLDIEKPELQEKIAKEGWGKKFLDLQHKNGHWGLGFYQPKWISTHYTLLDLRNLCISQENIKIRITVENIANNEKGKDGGINPAQYNNYTLVAGNTKF